MDLMRVQGLSLNQRLINIELALKPGELLGIIGPNGAGKSSLLESLAGLQPCSGVMTLNAQPLAEMDPRIRAQKVAFLPQQSSAAWALTVRDVIALGRLPWGDEPSEQIMAAAEQTGVADWLDVRVDHLSGGEQARVWLARVLVGEPDVILADEPLASLDLYYQQRMLAVMRQYVTAGRAVMLSMHDLAQAAAWCDRVVLMEAGRIQAIGPPHQVLTRDNIRQVYRVDAEIDFAAATPVLHLYGA